MFVGDLANDARQVREIGIRQQEISQWIAGS
jgi:hypothetical protein